MLINSNDYRYDHIGIVEDINDPLMAGRVRVRVFGIHPPDLAQLATDDLPWSQVMMPITSASLSGLGISPLGLEKGSMVYGVFLDDIEDKQQFLVLGSLPGISYQTNIQRQLAQDKINEDIDTINNTTFSANSNAEKAYAYFIAQGYSEEQAAGIVGSLVYESGNNLNTSNIGGLSDERYSNYKQYAAKKGKPSIDLDTQLEWINSELQSEKYNSVNQSLKNSKNSNDATLIFSRDFLEDGSTITTRQRKSREVKAAYGQSLGSTGNLETPNRPNKTYSLGDIIESEDELIAYFQTAKRQVTEIIVHHTDTYENQHVDAYDVDQWHKSRKTDPFSEIGYHFLILRNGEIQVGRNIDKIGAHAKTGGHNTYSIGIAFVGGIKGSSKNAGTERSAATFSEEQWVAFEIFCKTAIKRWPDINFLGHRDTDPMRRTDPEFDVVSYIKARFNHDNVATAATTPVDPSTKTKTASPTPSASSTETNSGTAIELGDAVPDEQITIITDQGITTTTPGGFNQIIDIDALISAAIAGISLGGSGTVTSVATGTGLTGGPITTTGTISLSAAAIASLAKADSALQSGANISLLSNDAGYITSTLSEEQVEDYVGGMLTGNTTTLITVTYQDSDGTIDFVVDNNLANYDNSTTQFTSNTGTVDTTGTPANNQIAIFTDANTIEGDSNFTWDGTNLDLISSDTLPVSIYRTTNVATAGVSINMQMQNSANVQTSYTYLTSAIESNTSGSENGSFSIYNNFNGTMTERLTLSSSGTLEIDDDFITQAGNIMVGRNTLDSTITGCEMRTIGFAAVTRDGGIPFLINRLTNDGDLLWFRQDSVTEGTISVSGTTVSYNGAHLSRWSQASDASGKNKLKDILPGTVMSNRNGRVTQVGKQDRLNHLNKVEISDTEGDINVAGVFEREETSEEIRWDFSIAQAGDYFIRIAKGTKVKIGDLLISAGDGTAKPQADDIIRSSTIAKVNANFKVHQYDDGSYTVPCILLLG